MLVTFDQTQCCANSAYVFLNNYSIDFDQASVKSRSIDFVRKKLKKSVGYGAQITETGVFVNHTFNVLGNFVCVKLSQVSPPTTTLLFQRPFS